MAFISFDESMKILNSLQFNNHNTHKRYLLDCLGFVLAKDIHAFENSPAYETSAMDGYAFKHKDISLEKLYIKAINPAGKLIDECVEMMVSVSKLLQVRLCLKVPIRLFP